MEEPLHAVRIHQIHAFSPDIRVLDLRARHDGCLPSFSAGAHIDLHLPNGLVRQYSLANDPQETHRYLLAVAREKNSRGGSAFIHASMREGDVVQIGAPRNLFPLAVGTGQSVLIAGGIGITPLCSMVQHLAAQGRPWTLHYAMRHRAQAVCLDMAHAAAARTAGGMVQTYCREVDGARMDIAGIIHAAPSDAHFYCCGPASMIAAFETACATLPRTQVHSEHFAPVAAPDVTGGFTVVLARSRRTLAIRAGKTILDVLKAAGVAVASSCHEGVCGMCETTVLEGMPDARDSILTDAEKAEGRTIMVCCSGSRTARLVLDL